MTMPAATRVPQTNDKAHESTQSAVTWSAVFAGAFVAFGTAFILLALGSGIGMSSVSPYAGAGVTVTTFSIYAAVWLIIVQWLSSGLGGYVTGRLRTKWVDLHDQEVSFRDTAHGLLAWAVAVALGVGLAALGGLTAGKMSTAPDRNGYYVDELFRADKPTSPTTLPDAKSQASRILTNSGASTTVSEADKKYLAQLVAGQVGVSATDAEQRVNTVAQQAKGDAEAARKVSARISMYICFSLLIGAFIASAAGAIGGRKRDSY